MSSRAQSTEPFPPFSISSNATSKPILIPGPSRRPPRHIPSFSSTDASPDQQPVPPPSIASSPTERLVQSVPDMSPMSTHFTTYLPPSPPQSRSPPLDIPDIVIPDSIAYAISARPSFYDRDFGPDDDELVYEVEDRPVTAMLSYEGLEELDPSLWEGEMAHRAMVQEDELFDFVYHGGWDAVDRSDEGEEEEKVGRDGDSLVVSGKGAEVKNEVPVTEGDETSQNPKEVKKKDAEHIPVSKVLKRTRKAGSHPDANVEGEKSKNW